MFGLSDFTIDWESKTVICPQGQLSSMWCEQKNAYDHDVIQIKFRPSVCKTCAARPQCTRSKRGARSLVLLPQAQHEAFQHVRKVQETPEFRAKYGKRSGIEGTLSQAVRACDLRRSRYIGLAKTHLQTIAIAAAINVHRVFDWLTEVPRSLTRISPVAQLAPDPRLVPTSWRA